MLILCVSVFFGIRSNMILEERITTFGEDFKSGARTAAFFAIFIAIITYVYYAKIDSNFFDIKSEPYIDAHKKEAFRKLATEPKEDVQKWLLMQLDNTRLYLSPYFQAMWTMFGLVFLGAVYSGMLAYLMKKIPGFKRK